MKLLLLNMKSNYHVTEYEPNTSGHIDDIRFQRLFDVDWKVYTLNKWDMSWQYHIQVDLDNLTEKDAPGVKQRANLFTMTKETVGTLADCICLDYVTLVFF